MDQFCYSRASIQIYNHNPIHFSYQAIWHLYRPVEGSQFLLLEYCFIWVEIQVINHLGVVYIVAHY